MNLSSNSRDGNDRIRTDDFMRAKHTFYQLNYIPIRVTGLEPV